MLKSLLPRGAAFSVETDSNVHKVCLAVADEFARFDARGENLIEELDPRTTFELLADWERVYGLPDPCLGANQNTAQRINSLVQKITAIGGQTAAYFIAVAAVLGFTITITEFRAHTVDDDVDYSLYGDDWNFAWQVNAPLNTVIEYTVSDTVDDALAVFGNAQLECVLQALKPAHTVIIFSYT